MKMKTNGEVFIMETNFEKELKKALFMNGHKAIEDFLGYDSDDYDVNEDRAITEKRIDDVMAQMPMDEQMEFYAKYGETKVLTLDCTALISYTQNVCVPKNLTKEQAIDFIKDIFMDLSRPCDFEFVPESDTINEELSEFDS